MGAGDINGRTVMPERCRCGHTRARHELPGFDGECVADRCRCTTYGVDVPPVPIATTPRGPSLSGSLATAEQVVAVASHIDSKRVRLTVARLEHTLAELRALIAAERFKIRAEAARKQITAIDDESKAAAKTRRRRGPLGDGTPHPCTHPGCDRPPFTSNQGLVLHRRRAHEGYQPPRKSTEHDQTEGANAS